MNLEGDGKTANYLMNMILYDISNGAAKLIDFVNAIGE